MKITTPTLILSIIKTEDIEFIEKKIDLLENQISLNQVEKQILKDIRRGTQTGNLVTAAFIKDKYSYYTENDKNIVPSYLGKDSIDSAITELAIAGSQRNLSKGLLDLAGQLGGMTPNEIKQKFNDLSTNILLTSKARMPTGSIKEQERPYQEYIKESSGLSLCIPKVEDYAGQALKGTVTSILGFTGSFKSAYALNIAYDNALSSSNVLYLSLESTATEMFQRLVLRHIALNAKDRSQAINSHDIRDKRLTAEKEELYDKTYNEIVRTTKDRLIIWDSTDIYYDTFLDMLNVLRQADKKFRDATGSGLDAVVLDQVALLKYTSGSGKRYGYDGALLNDWVSFFREQSLNFLDEGKQIAVILVSQTNRDAFITVSKAKSKGRYDASCASDAHELERSSSIMITLFKDLDKQNTLLVNIPKARKGFIPEHPIDVEVYGEYYHIGPLYFGAEDITADDFNKVYEIEDLIKN